MVQTLMPQFNSTFVLETDQSVQTTLEYFYGINEIIDKFDRTDEKLLSQQALSDLIGG